MHEVLVNRLGSLSLPRKGVVRSTDRPDMTLDVYRGRKTATQQQQQPKVNQNMNGYLHFLFAIDQKGDDFMNLLPHRKK